MLSIVTAPDDRLRQMCAPCEPGDESLRELAAQMAELMYRTDGVGIAAPQVGVLKRVIVVDCDVEAEELNPIVLVNPVLVQTKGDPVTDEEGCLSCPGISVPITRAPWASVDYLDLDGNPQHIESDGLLGRCLQHEIDHLDGKTLFESAAPMDRLRALSEYQLAKARGAKPGEVQ
ncbi:MAG: peptide deformylase [Eggerthellales bacterium]|nr:peptide deformylase [Eggerthellales bacterium]